MGRVPSGNESPFFEGHDVIASSSPANLEAGLDSYLLDTLSSRGTRSIDQLNDSRSSSHSPEASPAFSVTEFGPVITPNVASTEPHDGRPKWLIHSTIKGKQRIDSITGALRISPLVRWAQGPSSPRPYKIVALCPALQLFPATLVSRYPRVLVAWLLFLLWMITFIGLLASSKSAITSGTDIQSPVRLDCTTALWRNASACGLDGALCRPFEKASFPFICPADCASKQVLEPRTVGDQEIIYRNFVIGGQQDQSQGPPVYRGDSFICAAAVHAGVVSDFRGGCGILDRLGTQSGFTSTMRNGITSIGFEPEFPFSFSLSIADLPSLPCTDLQWALLIVSLMYTISISLVDSTPAQFFTTTFIICFFQVALASDAEYSPDFKGVVSLAFERFLPAAFVAAIIYWFCVRRTLTDMYAYWERTVLWLGGCWVGCLNVYTFDRIPISRLTPHDLKQQPGAIMALIIILGVIVLAAAGQVWAFRIEGRLLRYLGFYLGLAVLLGFLIAIPGLNFRLHHYIIGLLLLPGTSVQTRPSLLYQGILTGLFINGVARWGFASILQTAEALRGDAQLSSALPTTLIPLISSDTVTFTITKLAQGFDGLSILVNDVERFQQTNVSMPAVFNWTRTAADEATFFRFAFTGTYTLGGIWYGDYTKPGTLFANGTWLDVPPGSGK